MTPVDVVGLSSGIKAIASGSSVTCALTSTGKVKCWGAYQALTPVDVPGLTSVTAIAAGGPLCALTSAGDVKCWHGTSGSTPVDVPGLSTGVTSISSSTGHACAVVGSGGVKCWGLNDQGQLGDGTRADRQAPVTVSGLGHRVRTVAAGGFHTCAVLKTGSVECWGANESGQLGDDTNRRRLTPVGVTGFAPAHTSVSIISRVVTVTRAGVARIGLRCRAAGRCRGLLTLVAHGARELGARRFSLAPGGSRPVNVLLTARSFGLLVGAGRVSARARISYSQPTGGTTIAISRITLIAPRK